MEPSRDEILSATLESLRPAPSPAFAAELDARVADGFPRKSGKSTTPFAGIADRLRARRPRQLAFAGGAAALAAFAVAVVIVAGNSNPGESGDLVLSESGTAAPATPRHLEPAPKPIEEAFDAGSANKAGSGGGPGHEAAVPEYESVVPAAGGATAGSTEVETGAGEEVNRNSSFDGSGPYASQAHDRDVEYAAEIALGTEPEEVGDAAGKVFEAVHQYGGIVLDSSVHGGSEGDGSARFELLVPSAKLSDTLAAFSAIAEVRSRHETSNDITAPTVTTTELLQDSHARIESLLNELAASETDAEREVAEAKLRGERRHAANLKASLTNLQRRASFSHVSLRIESSDSSSTSTDTGGGWDVGDAFHDAGHILAVAAGVAIVGLAVLGPIALIALLAWLANRAWVRQRRERALG